MINLSNCHRQVEGICSQNTSKIFTKERIDKIRDNLFFTGKKYFDSNINISLHIRTANPNDIPSEVVSPYREKYNFEKDFNRYLNLINFLKENTKEQKATLHIHSQGFTSNFQEFLFYWIYLTIYFCLKIVDKLFPDHSDSLLPQLNYHRYYARRCSINDFYSQLY